MAQQRQISVDDANQVGARLGLDWTRIDPEQFRRGLEVELEHGARDAETNVTNDDMELTGKIAWAHLKELPDYYTRLDRLEAVADDDGMAFAASAHSLESTPASTERKELR
jgi:hypothetical protein